MGIVLLVTSFFTVSGTTIPVEATSGMVGTYDWGKPPAYDWNGNYNWGKSLQGGYDWSNPPSSPWNPVVKPVTPPANVTPPATIKSPEGIPAEEQWMVAKVNQERTSRGLNPLQVDPSLTELARKKSQDIVVNNYFAHQSPTYGSPSAMVTAAGIKYWMCGENLAKAGSVETAHQLLMDSSGHRANILNKDYTHIGIGIVPQKSGQGVVVTQLFIAR